MMLRYASDYFALGVLLNGLRSGIVYPCLG